MGGCIGAEIRTRDGLPGLRPGLAYIRCIDGAVTVGVAYQESHLDADVVAARAQCHNKGVSAF